MKNRQQTAMSDDTFKVDDSHCVKSFDAIFTYFVAFGMEMVFCIFANNLCNAFLSNKSKWQFVDCVCFHTVYTLM